MEHVKGHCAYAGCREWANQYNKHWVAFDEPIAGLEELGLPDIVGVWEFLCDDHAAVDIDVYREVEPPEQFARGEVPDGVRKFVLRDGHNDPGLAAVLYVARGERFVHLDKACAAA